MRKSLLAIVVITISALVFIHFSNNHEECSTEIKNSTDAYGNITKEEKHICREKYNF
ncbi:MAG: hypothetical protein KA463_06435 [Flavobacterium sp.]|jgi:peptidoglycan hydrolase CwlO-like protein|nr:hypothetical protein [Flavobacterium sp.]MBP6146807.1 hypothetical protein [Flavobacterium sp.]MBP7317839.1 hypothetical protein [Flavobacterium sp.]